MLQQEPLPDPLREFGNEAFSVHGHMQCERATDAHQVSG